MKSLKIVNIARQRTISGNVEHRSGRRDTTILAVQRKSINYSTASHFCLKLSVTFRRVFKAYKSSH